MEKQNKSNTHTHKIKNKNKNLQKLAKTLKKQPQKKENEYNEIELEFRNFLADKKVKNNVDPNTIYELINSHGRVSDAIYFATLVHDYEKVGCVYLVIFGCVHMYMHIFMIWLI